jgi:hypothetical protein
MSHMKIDAVLLAVTYHMHVMSIGLSISSAVSVCVWKRLACLKFPCCHLQTHNNSLIAMV